MARWVASQPQTGLVELNQATNNDWDNLGDIAVTFNAPSVALTETNFEARLQYELTGTSGNDVITTGALDDVINGAAGNDTLAGGGGNDTLIGGNGRDVMNGGTGADLYLFGTLSESGNTIPTADVISGWDASDEIDLSAIDANTGLAGDQSFTFGGVNPAVVPNQITVFQSGADTVVQLDNNGAGADMMFVLTGINAATLTEANFNL